MESNSNTSYESLLFNGKSPESSDCEGYGTPLASSLTDLHVARGELTPVSSRAISPACVREIMYLQKSSNLVMTQRMLSEEDIRRLLEQGFEQEQGSEEEFFDTADEEASELEDIVVDSDSEKPDDDDVAKVTASLLAKVADIEPVNEEEVMGVVHVEENVVLETSQTVDGEEVAEVPMEVEEASENEKVAPEAIEIVQKQDEEVPEQEVVVVTPEYFVEETQVDQEELTPVDSKVIVEVEVNDPEDVKVLEVSEVTMNKKQCQSPSLDKTSEEANLPEDVANNFTSELEDVEIAPEVIELTDQHIVPEPEAAPEVVAQEIKPETIAGVVEVVEIIQDTPDAPIAASETETELLNVVEVVEITPEDVQAAPDASVDLQAVSKAPEDVRGTPNAPEDVKASPNASEDVKAAPIALEDVQAAPDAPEDIQAAPEASNALAALEATEIADILDDLTEAVIDNEVSKDQTPEDVQNLTFAPEVVQTVPELLADVDSQEVTVTITDETEIATATVELSPVSYSSGVNTLDSGVSEQTSSNSSESGKLSYTPVSVQLLKSKFEAPFTSHKGDALPNLVNSDEVKATSGEVKVDFDADNEADNDADCELDGESLSSSTSTESFEFAETISPLNATRSPESTQALRNSINERYPSHETDEELDNEFDDDLLAVKQISAEVEQLVAAINAFGRDEEQQMSAYLVGKNMAAEKKRKMDASLSSRSDQLVQTDTDFILVDRHLPEVMESLQAEIARLQADLTSVKLEEKELQKLNAKLQDELQESQQTIDGIEVEAEQQYTELTSEIDELCTIVLKKDEELASLKEKVANLSVNEINHKDDVDAQRVIVQRQKEIIEGLREELDNLTKKLSEVTKSRDKAIEDATIYKMKNMERDRFLSKEAQMSMEIEDLQRELNKQKLILNNTSMAKLADTFDRKVLHLENELRERDMLICKQNQIINSHRKSPTGSIITQRKMQPRASVLAAAGNLNSAGSSSESFQNGLDIEAKEALLSFILSDRHNQLANIYNIGRILDLTSQEERAVERHLTKDRFT